MQLDPAELEKFRSRFEAKEPDPKNFFRRVTKFDFYLSVEDLVEDRRRKGFAWAGIAEDFTALGVAMPISTLKTCFRRARARRPGTVARPKRPSRLPHVRRARSAAPEVETPEVSAEAPDTAPTPPAEPAPAVRRAAPEPTISTPSPSTPPARDPAESRGAEGSREEESASLAIEQESGGDERAVAAVAVQGAMASGASPEASPTPPPEAGGLDAIRARASPRETRRLAFIPKPDGDL